MEKYGNEELLNDLFDLGFCPGAEYNIETDSIEKIIIAMDDDPMIMDVIEELIKDRDYNINLGFEEVREQEECSV